MKGDDIRKGLFSSHCIETIGKTDGSHRSEVRAVRYKNYLWVGVEEEPKVWDGSQHQDMILMVLVEDTTLMDLAQNVDLKDMLLIETITL